MVDRLNVPDDLNSLLEKREKERRQESQQADSTPPQTERRSGEDRRAPDGEQASTDET